MFEWWQALVLSVAGALVGGFITLVVSYATHRWTTTANREAEERESRRRAEEEERQERRRYRRERIGPVLEFLDSAKRHLSGETLVKAIDRVYEGSAETKKKMTLEEFREDVFRQRPSLRDHPDVTQLSLSFGVALSTAPTVEITEGINRVFVAVSRPALGTEAIASNAIMAVEEAVERYLIQV
jgi:hypothetical protein